MTESYLPLYLKYRPQKLADLVGQKSVAQTLVNAINQDRIAHAYLFTGPRGTGKTSSARIVAKSLNCINGPTSEPCLTCTSCVEIKQGISPAVLEIDAASNNSVDDARTLIERAPLVAQGGRFKLYIIDECHMLTKEAFNALLKTIEEPPPNVIFILATTEEHKVPQTIVSRCQRLMFKLVSLPELIEHLKNITKLENIHIENEALELIARRSGGGMRDALGLLDQASLLGTKEKPAGITELMMLLGAVHEDILLQVSSAIHDGDGQTVLAAVEKLTAEGREPSLVALELAKHFLNLAKARYALSGNPKPNTLTPPAILGSEKYLAALKEQAALFEPAELAQIIEKLDRLEQACRRSTQPSLHLEMGLVAICHREDIGLVKQLEENVSSILETLAKEGVALQTSISAPLPKQSHPKPEAPKYSVEAALVPTRVVEESKPQVKPIVDLRLEPITPTINEKTEIPAASNVVTTPAAATPVQSTESEKSKEDLDQFWCDLLDELQRKHLPTFSLVSTHGVPVRLSSKELVIGVMVDNFQKMIENKGTYIKEACATILGEALILKVKVVAGHQTQQTQPREQVRTKAPTPVETPKIAPLVANNKQTTEAKEKPAPKDEVTVSQSGYIVGNGVKQENALLSEAYKLFEGPGSRVIG